MDKSNVFRSSNFYMSDGDVLHIIIKDNTGDSLVVALTGTENGVDVTEDSNYTSPINMTDADGNIYSAVTIGTQMWMLQNLKTTKYNDGTAIPNITGYNDWHMPSEDELNYMFINLHSGIDQYLTVYAPVGGFANDSYWSSSEVNATQARAISFFNSSHLYDNKSDTHYVRACRAFTSSTVYALRDTGPSGGLIFYKNGDNYLEADAADASAAHTWSNIDALLVGTDTAIGTGKANSDAIIAQTADMIDGQTWNNGGFTILNPDGNDITVASDIGTFDHLIRLDTNTFTAGALMELNFFLTLNSGSLPFISIADDNGVVMYAKQITHTGLNTISIDTTGFVISPIEIYLYNSNVAGVPFATDFSLSGVTCNLTATDSGAELCEDLSGSAAWIADITGAYCWYDNDIANKDVYGALYNSYAVVNAHGLAPTDWRIPTKTDWQTLIDYAGGESFAGGQLRETGTEHWTSPNTGATDVVGFKGRGAGWRENATGVFASLNEWAIFASSTTPGAGQYFQPYLTYNDLACDVDGTNPPAFGVSVRCVRDL